MYRLFLMGSSDVLSRFILADTEQLHTKIADMSHRIRQLEDALAIFQSTVSDERHPLLCEELLKIKFGSEALPKARKTPAEEEEERTSQTIDAIGTLTLNESGACAYFGRSAGSEVRPRPLLVNAARSNIYPVYQTLMVRHSTSLS